MKKLLVIAIALFTLNGIAQEEKKKRHQDGKDKMALRKDMTPNEIADLRTKKLVLHLDLSDRQQNEVHQIILSQTEANQKMRNERKDSKTDKKEKPSKDEFLKMQNHRLDQQIAFKLKMKTVLTPEQYAKFEKIKSKKHRKKSKHAKK